MVLSPEEIDAILLGEYRKHYTPEERQLNVMGYQVECLMKEGGSSMQELVSSIELKKIAASKTQEEADAIWSEIIEREYRKLAQATPHQQEQPSMAKI